MSASICDLSSALPLKSPRVHAAVVSSADLRPGCLTIGITVRVLAWSIHAARLLSIDNASSCVVFSLVSSVGFPEVAST